MLKRRDALDHAQKDVLRQVFQIAGGRAVVTATANTAPGNYSVTATAVGGAHASFALANGSLVVTTALDEVYDTHGLNSLRMALAYAETLPGPSTITFDPAVFGTKRGTIVLTLGPLYLTDPAITIVGPGAKRLTISGGATARCST
jgi:hypothetical protein